MTPHVLEKFMLSFPGAAMSVQWGGNHIFKVGGKMFAILGPPENRMRGLMFKAGAASFAVLTKQKGIVPAPYLARAQWVQLERLSAMTDKELKAYLQRAHALIASGLSKNKRAALGIAQAISDDANPFL